MEFEIIKKSKISQARIGMLKTQHGVLETPSLVAVATQGVIKTLSSEEVKETKTQILICNTLYLHLKPGEKIIEEAGGLHQFMNWPGPLMTDSGGFQVFSWGFGREYRVGKILKKDFTARKITYGQEPKLLKITKEGVIFTSPFDGKKLFLGPKESIKIQKKLGADIIFAFDECTSPTANYQYTKNSLQRTHQWALSSLEEAQNSKSKEQAIFGIIQGGRYKDLRMESAKFIGALPFDGFGIGGEFGRDKKKMVEIIKVVISKLPKEKPRHLLGIGYLTDIPKIIKAGIDLFDCTVPTHYARRGVVFTSLGKLDLGQSKFLRDKNPLDKKCPCFVCQNYKRNYLSHLFRAKEITALKLFTFHNLYFFNQEVEKIRQEIKKGKF